MRKNNKILSIVPNMMKYITVIIPAYNEEKTIKSVIKVSKKSKNVKEIIVVDNCCTDNTAKIAKDTGAIVVKCSKRGKGYAMELGVKKAKYPIVVFLDADVKGYNTKIVDMLANPIIERDIDFVKSTFDRQAGGKVTEIATKPLLNILFPNIYKFQEPLSGMVAAKKYILERLYFEKDYGVDIGILLDIIELNSEIEEVNIGIIENMSHVGKTQEISVQMSYEVMKAILKRRPANNVMFEGIGV